MAPVRKKISECYPWFDKVLDANHSVQVIHNQFVNSARPIHLVIPMSGQGLRFREWGFSQPKPLIPVAGVPMIRRLIDCFPDRWPVHFIYATNHARSGLPEYLSEIRPKASLLAIDPHRLGPSYAALSSLSSLPDDVPVFISYCDYGMVWDPNRFSEFVAQTECDACLVSYRGFHAHYLSNRTYAYSRLEGECVREVREKASFTQNREEEYASSGGYYFRSARLLREAIEYQIKRELQWNGEYYTSLTVQALMEMKPDARVRVFEIPFFFQWGTPEDVRDYEYWHRTLSAWNRFTGKSAEDFSVSQIILPMAGRGSRFGSVVSAPKPLISIGEKPMYRAALESLPTAEAIALVTLEDLSPHLELTAISATPKLVTVRETPPGQALSVELGLPELKPTGDLLVSACDHAIVLDPERWKDFRARPDCEAAIFTVKGFPGAARSPLSYSFVEPENKEEPFPLVQRVSLKRSLSADPIREALLVGTFWFSSRDVLQRGIELLKARRDPSDGELYVDEVFEFLMADGIKVRMIPLDGFLCWGDPDCLKESLYWQEAFGGRWLAVRGKGR